MHHRSVKPVRNGVSAFVLPSGCQPTKEARYVTKEIAAAVPMVSKPSDIGGDRARPNQIEIFIAELMVHEPQETRETATHLRAVPRFINEWSYSAHIVLEKIAERSRSLEKYFFLLLASHFVSVADGDVPGWLTCLC